jgi:hypothetical protein
LQGIFFDLNQAEIQVVPHKPGDTGPRRETKFRVQRTKGNTKSQRKRVKGEQVRVLTAAINYLTRIFVEQNIPVPSPADSANSKNGHDLDLDLRTTNCNYGRGSHLHNTASDEGDSASEEELAAFLNGKRQI